MGSWGNKNILWAAKITFGVVKILRTAKHLGKIFWGGKIFGDDKNLEVAEFFWGGKKLYGQQKNIWGKFFRGMQNIFGMAKTLGGGVGDRLGHQTITNILAWLTFMCGL